MSVLRMLGEEDLRELGHTLGQRKKLLGRLTELAAYAGRGPQAAAEPEARRLDQALLGARPGQPAMVLLSGDAGIGKSTLAGAFAAGTERDGLGVLRLSCMALSAQVALHPVVELLEGMLGLRTGLSGMMGPEPDRQLLLGALARFMGPLEPRGKRGNGCGRRKQPCQTPGRCGRASAPPSGSRRPTAHSIKLNSRRGLPGSPRARSARRQPSLRATGSCSNDFARVLFDQIKSPGRNAL